jgi:secondary thiamine-phosphate synthase enzyme
MKSHEFMVRSRNRCEMIDITAQISDFLHNNPTSSGCITIFTPHTTAAVTINENADPDVVADLLLGLEKLVPPDPQFRHAEGNSDAHLKSSLIGVSETLLIENGRLVLGSWQGIYFCEFDGPRARRVRVKICSD